MYTTTNIQRTTQQFQFERYQRRGGRLPQGEHHLQHHQHATRAPLSTISRTHYSLCEATDHYNQWLNDPDCGPNPHHHNRAQDSPPYLPHSRHPLSPPASPDYDPESPPVSKPPTPRRTKPTSTKRLAHKHSSRISKPPRTTPTQS